MPIVKSQHIIALIGLLLSLCVSACDVHEFPDDMDIVTRVPDTEQSDGTVRTVHFTFEFESDWEIYPKNISLTTNRSDDNSLKIRHTINIYRGTNIIATGSNTPEYSYTIIKDITRDLNFTADFDLPGGQYTCLVWSDYVYGDGRDLYYNTLDFHKLSYVSRNSYRANTDSRNGYRGKEEFKVANVTNNVNVLLKSPLAKYELLVSGLDEYIADALEEPTADIDIHDYTVTVNYTGFMPGEFNLFSNTVSDYWSDMKYSGTPHYYHESTEGAINTDDDILLAEDYVFVNNTETEINIYLEVRDQSENLILQSSVFAVPLIRSCDTIVRGSFMSNTSSGGAIINADYAGQFNIIV